MICAWVGVFDIAIETAAGCGVTGVSCGIFWPGSTLGFAMVEAANF